MARYRRRGGRNNAGQIALIGALAAALVVLVGCLAWLFTKARNDYVPRDTATLCPLAGYSSQTIVLIDTTDPLAPVTQTQVLGKLKDLVAGIPKGGLMELRLLRADPTASAAVLTLCNPGDGSDLDPLTSNPERAKARWQTEYVRRLDAAVDEAVNGSEQKFSPIMETIQRIAAERLTTAHDRSIPSHLVVVSDMVQHSPSYSQFREGLSLEAYERVAKQRMATDLAGAEVEYWLVRRENKRIDPDALSAFWLVWAEANHAKVPAKLIPLMGM